MDREIKMRRLMGYNKFVWSMFHIYGLTGQEMIKVWKENGMVYEENSMRDGL
jgi:hypothetical protein